MKKVFAQNPEITIGKLQAIIKAGSHTVYNYINAINREPGWDVRQKFKLTVPFNAVFDPNRAGGECGTTVLIVISKGE